MAADFDTRLSASRVRLRARLPFFGALLLFARVVPDESVSLASTDGRDLYVNPTATAALTSAEFDGLLLHEVLHAALLHVDRRGAREPLRWNVAADIVVNGMIASLPAIALPAGGVRDASLEALPVEEVYERLEGRVIALALRDLRDAPGTETPDGEALRAHREAHWREALAHAECMTGLGMGTLPAGLLRALREVTAPEIDWRVALWRFLTRTPDDFAGFDRRFIHRGLYLDALDTESLRVDVALDTSGSISARQLDAFVGELRGIVASYPHVDARLSYCDAALDGPYALTDVERLPAPRGGGGTSFIPFFDHAACTRDHTMRVLVYLTDGYGTFPADAPPEPVLWVVTAGGLAREQFPFGEVTRLRGV